MARLRAPDGCPWDRKQTHESLKPYLVEETYEVLEALDHNETARLREELGDLLLQILFHAQIATEAGAFTIDDVMQRLAEKLIRRHPHVFGTAEQREPSLHPEEVKARWEQIKRGEREQRGEQGSALDGVPKTLPALLRAYQIQARAARVGFDWPQLDQVVQKLEEELRELRSAIAERASEGADAQPSSPNGQVQARAGAVPQPKLPHDQVEAELGDVLFTLVNLARFLKVNPEEALRRTIQRFIDRFQFIERQAAASGRKLEDMTLAEMDELWEEAKSRDR